MIKDTLLKILLAWDAVIMLTGIPYVIKGSQSASAKGGTLGDSLGPILIGMFILSSTVIVALIAVVYRIVGQYKGAHKESGDNIATIILALMPLAAILAFRALVL